MEQLSVFQKNVSLPGSLLTQLLARQLRAVFMSVATLPVRILQLGPENEFSN